MSFLYLGRVTALLLCVLLFPAHVVLCAIIWISDGGPPLYRCRRIGRSGSLFELQKYRTLKRDAGHLLSSGLRMVVIERDPRVTKLGRLLRCGIDELPQLWNVAKGEMAWIGPRPDPDWMLPHYGPTSRERLQMAPGITGFAQLLNSRHLSTSEAFALDIWYVTHRTLRLDFWIALATPLFIVGWHSLGEHQLRRLRKDVEFRSICRRCDKEFTRSKKILLTSGLSSSLLPPNTVLC